MSADPLQVKAFQRSPHLLREVARGPARLLAVTGHHRGKVGVTAAHEDCYIANTLTATVVLDATVEHVEERQVGRVQS